MIIKKIIYKITKSILKKFDFTIVKKENKNLMYQYPEYFKKELKIITNAKLYTMTSYKNLNFLLRSFQHVINNNLEGDFVECGVWKGGNIILLKNLMTDYKIKKQIYAYDTFEGMTKPTAIDKDIRFKKEKASDLMKKI